MSVITVTGEINENDLGVTAVHEHIVVNLLNKFKEPKEPSEKLLSDQKVNIENLGVLKRNPFAIKDNLIISNLEEAKRELTEFKNAGGKTIVDPTCIGMGRDPITLKKISKGLDINIVAATGYYMNLNQSSEFKEISIEEITEEMIKDIEIGINGTKVRAGIIGELGTSEVIYPNEEKILIAAARVNKKLGIPIMIHTECRERRALDILKILSINGTNLEKVNICHLDSSFDYSYCEKVIKMGAYAGFDTFGQEIYFYRMHATTDVQRIKNLLKLIRNGYIKKVLVSCDVCIKMFLHKYGGWGYDHFLNNIVPLLKNEGLDDEQIKNLLIDNPKNYLNI